VSILLSARTFEELHDRLPDMNVEVPPRPERRDDKPEIHSIIRLLANTP
jgi:transcriptional regulator of acetoin/glycerol metabolism